MVFLGLSESKFSKHYLIFEFQWPKFGNLLIFVEKEFEFTDIFCQTVLLLTKGCKDFE